MPRITLKIAPAVWLLFLVSGALHATPCVYDADCILAGFDYLETLPGTYVTIGTTVVPLVGNPPNPLYPVDTIVDRLSNIDVPDVVDATGTVGTMMTLLSLTGIDPDCPQTGSACNVFVNLDPVDPSTGMLTFLQTVNGENPLGEGTFTSAFDIFVDLTFTTLTGTPLPCNSSGATTGHACELPELTLTGSGTWTDDNGQFWVVGNVVNEMETGPIAAVHRAIFTPEPSTVILVGMGLGAVALWKRRQFRR